MRTPLSLLALSALLLGACGPDTSEQPSPPAEQDMGAMTDLSTTPGEDMPGEDMTPGEDLGPSEEMGLDAPADMPARDMSQDMSMNDQGEDMAEDMAPMPPRSPICELEVTSLQATGQDIAVTPGAGALAAALAMAQPGDRLLLADGTYEKEAIEVAFTDHVFIEAASGAKPVIQGIDCKFCSHLVFRNVAFDGATVNLDASDHIVFDHVTMTAPENTSVMRIYGQRNGACSDIDVFDSEILGGQRTIFILGKFAPSETWNHDLRFVRTHVECGTNNCFQISGGRDVLIADSLLTSQKSVAVLTAGATRVQIQRNRIEGRDQANTAMNIATPGREWDNYGGVGNMISSDIQIMNNLLTGWNNNGIQLNAARDIDIAHNTVIGGSGLRTSHRTPHEYMSDEVVLEGNQDYRVWNNIFDKVAIDTKDPRPTFESSNIVTGNGGGGMNLITADPMLSGAPDYAPQAGSPAIDAGDATHPDSPTLDRFGNPRDATPDIGALELDSAPVTCP